jgi:hypothetical protein
MAGFPVSISCPHCRQLGTFLPIAQILDCWTGENYVGHRVCPNARCKQHVFVVCKGDQSLVESYPAQRISFDATKIPATIVSTFEEAITCHAEKLHVASAIMIRRTLEELCENKTAIGKTLQERLKALKTSVLLPNGLLDALDDLRLLGNDAAHIEAKTYNSVGNDEITIAIELTKEILKGVYQLDNLLDRLRALKK